MKIDDWKYRVVYGDDSYPFIMLSTCADQDLIPEKVLFEMYYGAEKLCDAYYADYNNVGCVSKIVISDQKFFGDLTLPAPKPFIYDVRGCHISGLITIL